MSIDPPMSLSHHTYFTQVVQKAVKLDPKALVAVVSSQGLVLVSNTDDEDLEAQLASYGSAYLEYGSRLFAVPPAEGTEPDRIQSVITVGRERFVLICHLVADTAVVIAGRDKDRVGDLLRYAYEEVNRVNGMLQSKEILF
jgi:predicted regulator of Ras-like GTPase activity (Roadblock/LC7/MglB family)